MFTHSVTPKGFRFHKNKVKSDLFKEHCSFRGHPNTQSLFPDAAVTLTEMAIKGREAEAHVPFRTLLGIGVHALKSNLKLD